MSDAGGSSRSSCSVEPLRTPADVKDHLVLNTPTNKLVGYLAIAKTDSPVTELAKDLGELSTCM